MTERKFKPIKTWFRESIYPGKGNHRVYRFPNGFGASVIDDGYGAEDGLFELALVKFKGRGALNYKLAESSPDFEDVHGWLSEKDIQKLLNKIAKLKKVKP